MLVACKSKLSARKARYAKLLQKKADLNTAGFFQAWALVRRMTKWRRLHSRQGPSKKGNKLPSTMLVRFKLLAHKLRTTAPNQIALMRQISRLMASSWSVLILYSRGPSIDKKPIQKTAQKPTLIRSLSWEMSTKWPKARQSKSPSLERKECQSCS